MDYPSASIIVPAKELNDNLKECISHCLNLDYPDYEILVLPDEAFSLETSERVKIIPTGRIGPSEKRDMAIVRSKGEILAFLDDDAFPRRDWLKNAIRDFEDLEVAAVGGPAVTPENNSIRQKASGLVYSSYLASGGNVYRYIPKKRREVDDYPSCNFIVRKSAMRELGGFKSKFWPGEDTAICLRITKALNKKIIYDPEVLVYHHRRNLFIPHLKQVRNYALHRGYFAKRFPETSLRLSYFLPSLFVIGLVVGAIFALAFPLLRVTYFSIVGLYLFLTFLSGLRHKNLRLVWLIFSGIILTHLCYGVWFIKGLFSRRLEEE